MDGALALFFLFFSFFFSPADWIMDGGERKGKVDPDVALFFSENPDCRFFWSIVTS